MDRPPDCRDLRERLDEAAVGVRPEWETHLRTCADCAELVRRQRSLVRLLSRQPRAPLAAFPAPALPAGPAMRPRLVRASWIAAAAAALLVAVILRAAPSQHARVQVDTVVDVADAPPPADDSLLALTAGMEAVAMRRPTEAK
jgi:hypothetical protein